MREIQEVYSAARIADRVKALAGEITTAYDGRELTILGTPDDSFVFMADLLRAIRLPLQSAFLHYTHHSLGGIQDISYSSQMDMARRDVLLVEGVLDTGVPQEYLMRQLGSHGVASCRLCVLLDKPGRRRVDLNPDWRAFETQEAFVFGYGLGFQDRWRELPYLAVFGGAEAQT